MDTLWWRTIHSRESSVLALFTVQLLLEVCQCLADAKIKAHLESAAAELGKGHLHEALEHYHHAVAADPSDLMTRYKRALVCQALGKTNCAINDFDEILSVNPNFHVARVSRGKIHAQQGNYDSAQLDFHYVMQEDPFNAEVNEHIAKLDTIKQQLEHALHYYRIGDYRNAIAFMNTVIEYSPSSSQFYKIRSDMYQELGDIKMMLNDLHSSTKLQLDNTDGYLKLSKIQYEYGQVAGAMSSIRECLTLDPEHSDGMKYYRYIKKVAKPFENAQKHLENEQYKEAVQNGEKALQMEKTNNAYITYELKKILCTAYVKNEQSEEAINACDEVLKLGGDDAHVLCDRADAYLQMDAFDDALVDYRAANKLDPYLDRAKEGIQTAEQRQKASEKRDYYKILGVKRTADKREVTKAYRKLAMKYHPDNFPNDEKQRKLAEKKFQDIAAAKEVLTDPEKRQKFDSGIDPLDPESGSHHMPNAQFFQSFQGSPFQFHFRFN